MAKEILFNEDARRALGRGVDALANAVIRGDYGVGGYRYLYGYQRLFDRSRSV